MTKAGVKLAVYENGNRTGPWIVFLHDFAGSSQQWRYQFADPVLTAKYHLLAIDMVGHGTSEKPLSNTYYNRGDLYGSEIDSILTKFGIRRFVAVGHGLGGIHALDYLRLNGTSKVRGIVFASCAINIGPVPNGGVFDNTSNVDRANLLSDMTSTTSFIARVSGAIRWVNSYAIRPIADSDFWTMIASSLVVPGEVGQNFLNRGMVSNQVLLRNNNQTPMALFYGTSDDVVSANITSYVTGLVPNAKVTLYSFVGHFPQLEVPSKFNSDLNSFMSSLP
jgi:pimeloyl-ACP methyl ester carboxylesterase